MDFGIFMEFEIRAANQAGAFEEGFHFVDVAEAWGLDIAWLGEMHFSPSRSVLSAPIAVASAIASRTRRMRVGLAVQVLPLNNPLRIAEEVATVDHISQGRFDFGIGRSGFPRVYDIYGVPYAESQGRFQEPSKSSWRRGKASRSATRESSTSSRMPRSPLDRISSRIHHCAWPPPPRRPSRVSVRWGCPSSWGCAAWTPPCCRNT